MSALTLVLAKLGLILLKKPATIRFVGVGGGSRWLTFASNLVVCLIEAFNFDTPGIPLPSRWSMGTGLTVAGDDEGPAFALRLNAADFCVRSGPMSNTTVLVYVCKVDREVLKL